MVEDMKRDDEAPRTAPVPGSWAAIGGVAAMVMCCLGHGLLLAFGAAGFTAAAGAAAGSPVVVIGAVVVFAGSGALIADRLRRRSHGKPEKSPPLNPRRNPEVTDHPDIAARLAAAGLPADNLTARRAQLPAPLQDLHGRVLTTIAATGQAPTPEQVTNWADQLGLDAASALRRLADSELIFLGDDRAAAAETQVPAVTGGVPFAAPGATAHRVQISGGPEVTANCAVDALGIPAMIGRDVEVRSTDPLSRTPITVVSHDGQWTAEPSTAVVFVGSSASPSSSVTESCCPVINFFANADNARSYQERRHLNGEVLTLAEAAEAGALVFGDLLARLAVDS